MSKRSEEYPIIFLVAFCEETLTSCSCHNDPPCETEQGIQQQDIWRDQQFLSKCLLWLLVNSPLFCTTVCSNLKCANVYACVSLHSEFTMSLFKN